MIDSTPVVAVQVNSDNSLLVTNGVDYNKDGVMVGGEITSQYTLVPGDSLDGQPTEVVKIANALWNPAVIEAYKMANPVIAPPLPWLPPVMIVPPMLPQVTPVLVAEEAVSVDTAA